MKPLFFNAFISVIELPRILASSPKDVRNNNIYHIVSKNTPSSIDGGMNCVYTMSSK